MELETLLLQVRRFTNELRIVMSKVTERHEMERETGHSGYWPGPLRNALVTVDREIESELESLPPPPPQLPPFQRGLISISWPAVT